jgi:hypothetical protein
MDAKRLLSAVIAGVAASVAIAGQAAAATTLGETFGPGPGMCTTPGNPATALMTVSPAAPAAQFTAASAGVITSWSVQTADTAPRSIKLKVGHPTATPGEVTITGAGEFETPGVNQVNTFPARVPIGAGDSIGFSQPTGTAWACVRSAPGYFARTNNMIDPEPGTTTGGWGVGPGEVPISAEVEPDADNDGFGDESQDKCPGAPGTTEGCPIPETVIDSKPKRKLKTKKKRVKVSFGFSSPVSGTTFECSLDGKPLVVCTSPSAYKVKKGKHRFAVQARTPAGPDPTPATAKVKVKRKP